MAGNRFALAAACALASSLCGCLADPDPTFSLEADSAQSWAGDRALGGHFQTTFEHGELLVWGTVEGPHLRRGQVVGWADVAIVDADGKTVREHRSTYHEPVASDPPAAAAMFCARFAEPLPPGWRVTIAHHPRVFDR